MRKQEKKVEQDDDENKDKFKTFMGARVMWPPDIPDNMLKLCISKTTELFQNNHEELQNKG